MNYYQRHLGDYARDTGQLSMLEHGAYTLLLDWYYANEKPIPAEKAYRIAKASTPTERKAVDQVLREYFIAGQAKDRVPTSAEVFFQRRADSEIARATEKSDKARLSARKRWEDDIRSHSDGNADASADESADACETHLRTPCETDATCARVHTPHSTLQDSRKNQKLTPLPPKPKNGFDPSEIDIPDFIPRQLWIEWCADRKARKKPITERAASMQLEKLAQWETSGLDACSAIRNSIESGYQGLFEPKPKALAKPSPNGSHGIVHLGPNDVT